MLFNESQVYPACIEPSPIPGRVCRMKNRRIRFISKRWNYENQYSRDVPAVYEKSVPILCNSAHAFSPTAETCEDISRSWLDSIQPIRVVRHTGTRLKMAPMEPREFSIEGMLPELYDTAGDSTFTANKSMTDEFPEYMIHGVISEVSEGDWVVLSSAFA